MIVVAIDVAALQGAFTYRSKGNFAQAADFPHDHGTAFVQV